MKVSRGLLLALSLCLYTSTHAIPTFTTTWQDPVGDTASDLPSSISDVSVVAGVDTDGDGAKEIIYLRGNWNSFRADLVIYENNGPNSFALVYSDAVTISIDCMPSSYVSCKVADTDHDGFKEIWFVAGDPSGGGENEIFVYENTGNNAWGTGQTASTDEYTQAFTGEDGIDTEFLDLAIDDVDGDGTDEIVINDDEGNQVKVLNVVGDIGAGATMSVESASLGALGGSPYPVLIDDFDGDGKKEIIVGEYSFVGIEIFEATAPDTYAKVADLSPGPAPTDHMMKSECLAVADFGGGTRALFFPNSEDGELYVLGNNGDSSTLTVADAKLFVSNTTLGLSDLDLSSSIDGSTMAGQSLAVGDADGNGRPEIYYGAYKDVMENLGEVFVIEYNGTGDVTLGSNYTVGTALTTGLSFPDFPGAVTPPVDLDGDGLPEIVVGGPDSTDMPNSTGHALRVYELLPAPSSAMNWSMY